jgi:hypothetical protein
METAELEQLKMDVEEEIGPVSDEEILEIVAEQENGGGEMTEASVDFSREDLANQAISEIMNMSSDEFDDFSDEHEISESEEMSEEEDEDEVQNYSKRRKTAEDLSEVIMNMSEEELETVRENFSGFDTSFARRGSALRRLANRGSVGGRIRDSRVGQAAGATGRFVGRGGKQIGQHAAGGAKGVAAGAAGAARGVAAGAKATGRAAKAAPRTALKGVVGGAKGVAAGAVGAAKGAAAAGKAVGRAGAATGKYVAKNKEGAILAGGALAVGGGIATASALRKKKEDAAAMAVEEIMSMSDDDFNSFQEEATANMSANGTQQEDAEEFATDVNPSGGLGDHKMFPGLRLGSKRALSELLGMDREELGDPQNMAWVSERFNAINDKKAKAMVAAKLKTAGIDVSKLSSFSESFSEWAEATFMESSQEEDTDSGEAVEASEEESNNGEAQSTEEMSGGEDTKSDSTSATTEVARESGENFSQLNHVKNGVQSTFEERSSFLKGN